jgi:hypothetical protein
LDERRAASRKEAARRRNPKQKMSKTRIALPFAKRCGFYCRVVCSMLTAFVKSFACGVGAASAAFRPALLESIGSRGFFNKFSINSLCEDLMINLFFFRQ